MHNALVTSTWLNEFLLMCNLRPAQGIEHSFLQRHSFSLSTALTFGVGRFFVGRGSLVHCRQLTLTPATTHWMSVAPTHHLSLVLFLQCLHLLTMFTHFLHTTFPISGNYQSILYFLFCFVLFQFCCCCCCCFWPHHTACGTSLTRDWTHSPCSGRAES